MKIDALIKLAAVYAKSVPDILKMKEMLEGKDEDKTNTESNYLLEKLRSNDAAIDKLTEILLDIGIGQIKQ